ncbi:MAG: PorV/PorQ family protein [Bacteroidia bacterium]|nr:PorV/PorQ family protein [Bacteroidia bacterium]
MAVLIGYVAPAQTARKYSNEFLKIGVGARAAALGNAYSALVDDATAGFWNPAALTGLEKGYEIALMHSEQFAGVVKYDYGTFATRVDAQSAFALTVVRLGVDDIPNTLNFRDGNSFNYARITAFSVADLALLVSYARKLSAVPGLSVGGNFKLINRTVGQFATAWGFGLDVGAHYVRGPWRLGLVLVDATSTFNLWSFNTEPVEATFLATGNELPVNSIELTLPSARLGVARRFGDPAKLAINAALEAEFTFDGQRNTLVGSDAVSVDPKLGLEGVFKNLVSVRLGVYNLQYVETVAGGRQLELAPSAGVGLRLPLKKYTLQLDYALTNLSGFDDNLASNLVSVRFGFDTLNK